MGWRDFGKLAKTWLDSEKTELFSTDPRRSEAAARERREQEQQAKDDAGYAMLESILPPDLAARVENARPENVRARHEAQRRQELAAQSTAHLRLTMTGEITGSLEADLAFELTETPADEPADEPGYASGDVPTLALRLEAPDPLPFGSEPLMVVSIVVPHYHGPGRYDLAQMWQQVEAGTLAEWDLLDILFQMRDESTDIDPMWSSAEGPSTIDVTETSVSFDLGMASAAGSSRAVGSIEWAAAPAGEPAAAPAAKPGAEPAAGQAAGQTAPPATGAPPASATHTAPQ